MWIQNNSFLRCFGLFRHVHFYFSDARSMARDVHEIVVEVVKEKGQMTQDQALAYVKKMEAQKRYSADVWSWAKSAQIFPLNIIKDWNILLLMSSYKLIFCVCNNLFNNSSIPNYIYWQYHFKRLDVQKLQFNFKINYNLML